MNRRRIVAVSAGLREPSSTRILADQLVAATDRAVRLRGEGSSQTTVIELRELAHDVTDHLLTGFPSPRLEAAQRAVAEADAVVAVTPVFSASYTGLFKAFFDVLEEGTLAGKPVLIAATAGSARHSLVLEHALRPLFAYLKAVVVPTAVFAASADFGSARADDGTGPLSERVDRAAGELADLVTAGSTSPPRDPFAEPTPFAELLGADR